MEDIAFSDWPGQSVDLSGSNPWLPAYGFQQPILEKDDFLGSPDAALFLNGGPTHPYVFLETIVEETSDDLRSTDSERSASRGSHEEDERNRLGWLATDSESGSVIRVNVTAADDGDDRNSSDGSASECDIVCPAKRRRRHHDTLTITTPSNNNLLNTTPQINNNYNSCDEDTASLPSLSRSSSLLQFETLEKRCQEDMYNSSPSILSTFSYDSLENQQQAKNRLSPDSLNNVHQHSTSSDSDQESTEDSYRSGDDCEYYRTIRIDGKIKRHRGRDSLLYKTKILQTKNSDADSENSSTESDEHTHYPLARNLKTYRSFESLNTNNNNNNNNGHKKEKMSAENLSEDSGYCGDHLVLKQKSSSIPNFHVQGIIIPEETMTKHEPTTKHTTLKPPATVFRKNHTGFDAYDGETHFVSNTASHFGTSYQDLSIFDPNKINIQFKNNLQKLGRYQKRGKRASRNQFDDDNDDEFNEIDELERETQSLKLEIASEFTWPKPPKFSGASSASEPNLLNAVDAAVGRRGAGDAQSSFTTRARNNGSYHDLYSTDLYTDCSNGDFSVSSSVPQNLNLIGVVNSQTTDTANKVSVAFKNIDLCDFAKQDELFCAKNCEKNCVKMENNDKANISTDNNTIIIHLKGSDMDNLCSENRTVVGVEHSSDAVDADVSIVEADVEKSSFSTNDGVSKLLDVTADNRCYNLDIHSDILEFESNLQKAISNSSIPSFKDKADFFFHSTPMNRSQNVRSTPNLSSITSEKDTFDDILTNRGSMQHVPLKNTDSDSYMKRLSGSEGKNVGGGILMHRNSLAGSGSTTKGVHFCEIVSEVSWREVSYSDDDPNSRSNSVDSIGDNNEAPAEEDEEEEQAAEQHDDLEEIMLKVADQIEQQKEGQKYNSVFVTSAQDKEGNSKQTYLTNTAITNRLNQRAIEDDGTPPNHVTPAAEKVVERLVTRIEVPQEPISSSTSATSATATTVNNHKRQHSSSVNVVKEHVTSATVTANKMDSNSNSVAPNQTVDQQQSSSKPKHTKTSGVNKLGGFLSRFTNFRFSTRSKNHDKKKSAKTQQQVQETKQTKNSGVSTGATGKDDNKPDYIYIPLKGPPRENSKNSDSNSAPSSGVISKVIVDGKPLNQTTPSELMCNNPASVTSKPPLPKLPPRIIGASVKQRNQQQTTQTPVASSIDSGDISTGSGVSIQKSGNRSGSTGIDRHAAAVALHSSGTGAVGTHREAFNGRSSSGSGHHHAQMEQKPLGLIETDLDTHITVVNHNPVAKNNGHKTRSLMNLGVTGAGVDKNTSSSSSSGQTDQHLRVGGDHQVTVRPHKSMEFLLDKENLKVVEPPENELQKGGTGERVMSEHQLRVQRSLQKLNVPDWFKQSQVPREGFLLKKQRDTNKWSGLSGKTTSLSSLGGSRQSPILLSPSPQNTTGQIGGFTRWSTSKLNSTASSPCNSTRSSFNYRQPITGLTVNGTTSPCSSTRSSFNYRQPYLGWRSQERLSKPRTPAERLATTLLPPPVTTSANSEIQSSIKEVTSAIVHYVSGLTPDTNPSDGLHVKKDRLHDYETTSQRSISPASRGSGKLCWLESSFVGTRPLDSPETPIGIPTDGPSSDMDTIRNTHYPALHLDLKTKNSVNSTENFYPYVNSSSGSLARSTTTTTVRPSPGSTTLEDVLDSLLGLPPSTRAPSPSLQETVSVNSSPGHFMSENLSKSDQNRLLSVSSSKPSYCDTFRRRSEGSNTADHDKTLQTDSEPRRVSFHVTPDSASGIVNWNTSMVKCRYTKCTIQAPYEEAKKYFKNCHNCNYTYCSRECRRAHWEKHRKTCLHSRASTLCRQILAKAKDDADSLKHISLIARQGYLSHGPGVVKCFFPSPEAAERFIEHGLPELSEPIYIRWPDLLPLEMGPELFSELVKICKSYNPDTRLVLYVAVCVVSEVPSAGTIKWERQLVSRCAKLRLSKAIQIDTSAKPAAQRPTSPLNITHDTDNQNGGDETVKKTRELSFTNIQQQLKQRGISLRRHFPDVYQKLRAYVEGASDRFTPVTVYPKDSSSGKNFMCIIMPDADGSDKLDLVPTTDSSRFQAIDVTSEEQLK